MGAQDFSDCSALPAWVSTHVTCLLLCWPHTGQVSINIFQHDFVKLPGSSCQQLMLYILKDNQHEEILVWKGPHQVTYPSPTAFRQDEMLTPTPTGICLSNLFPKPPVQQIRNYSTSLSQHYSSLATKNPTYLPPPGVQTALTGFSGAD